MKQETSEEKIILTKEEYKSLLKEAIQDYNLSATEWAIATEAKGKGKETHHIILKDDGQYEIRILKKNLPDEIISQTDSNFQSLFVDIIVAELQKDKVKYVNALIQKLRSVGADSTRVPQFFAMIINDVVAKATS